jgi:hypothetical protein
MSPDVQVGHVYVALNLQHKGGITIPLWSIAISEKIEGGFISFKVIEPNGNTYFIATGYDNFVHLFKPITSVPAWLEQ